MDREVALVAVRHQSFQHPAYGQQHHKADGNQNDPHD
jgi:hypothetical protein